MSVPNLYEKRLVNCTNCGGRGFIPIYHDETIECGICSGSKKEVREVLVSYDRMLEIVDEEFGGLDPSKPSTLIKIMRTYEFWNDSR